MEQEIKFDPIAGKNSEMLYAKPTVLNFYNDYFTLKSEYGFSRSNEDEMMPHKDISVDDMSFYFREHISCVEWAYCSESEVWFFQIWHGGENSYCNVKSKEIAIGIVERIKEWKLNKSIKH